MSLPLPFKPPITVVNIEKMKASSSLVPFVHGHWFMFLNQAGLWVVPSPLLLVADGVKPSPHVHPWVLANVCVSVSPALPGWVLLLWKRATSGREVALESVTTWKLATHSTSTPSPLCMIILKLLTAMQDSFDCCAKLKRYKFGYFFAYKMSISHKNTPVTPWK